MFRLIFWLLFGDRRPLIEDIRHLSSPIIRRSAMTALLHANRKEDYILVQAACQVIIDRYGARNGQAHNAPQDNVRPIQQGQQQNNSNPNNQRR